VALNSVLWQVTRMVLPALGGLLLAWYDPALIFVLAGVGYLVMLFVIVGIALQLPGERSASPLQQTLEGIRFIAGQPLFRGLILLSYATMLFLSSYMQLMPSFAALLAAGPKGFGILMSATGAGSILGTALVGAWQPGAAYGRIMLASALFAATMLFGFAAVVLVPSFAAAVVFALLAATGTSVFLVLSTTAMQAKVPDALRGRVMGIHGITYSLMPLGALVTGALGDVIGTPLALMVGLTVYLALLGWFGMGSRTVRGVAAPES
jgi:hypothetical protein